MSGTDKDKGEGRRQGRDAYDWIVLVVAFLALVVAGAAAWFTWEQAAIARDQMRRALRAYVVVAAKLVRGSADPEGPLVQLDLENMGQTPVYDASVTPLTAALGIEETRLPFSMVMRLDCEHHLAQPQVRGETFGKTHAVYSGIGPQSSRAGRDLPALRSGEKMLMAYGTACYRDVFGAVHAARFCFQWFSESAPPRRCSHDVETND